MKSVLVTGASGLLGSNIADEWKNRFKLTGISSSGKSHLKEIPGFSVDITRQHDVSEFLNRNHFDLIIHCAALANVELCEKEPALAKGINAYGTRNLVQGFKGKFIYISTDMLFDGEKESYTEEDTPAPVNNYGKTKLEGEDFVSRLSDDFLIIRTNFFGWNHVAGRESSAEWVYNRLQRGEKIDLFYDYFFTPVYIGFVINTILQLLEGGGKGIFHIVGAETVSKYNFGVALSEKFGFDKGLINRVSIDEAEFLSKRPKRMSLSSNKLRVAGINPLSLRESISEFYNAKP